MITALAASAFALTFTASSDAHAERLAACGGVWLEGLAEGSCEVVPAQECETRCEAVSFVTVCAARLTTDCNSACTVDVAVDCEVGCGETCVNDCEKTVAEQPPNCMGLCMSDCQMDATSACEDDDAKGECRSSGAHCCADRCHAECSQTQETTCEPVCDRACYGSCEARANLDCQIECQSERFNFCQRIVLEECNTECEETGAAIFCEGQFLATGGDLRACADDLRASFDIELDVDIDVDVDCEGDLCDGDTWKSRFTCAVEPKQRQGLGFGLAVLALLGMGARRRRRG
jgi:MYXO-CTERM domain-containing protein